MYKNTIVGKIYKNAIVGAGITGMVLKKFFPNSSIISKRKGKIPPLFLLWKTFYTKKFVKDYGITATEKKIFFNYLIDEKYSFDEMIEKYNLITFKTKNSIPSKTKKKYINYLEINGKELNDEINYKKNIYNIKELKKYEKIFWCAPLGNIFGNKQKINPIYFFIFESRKELFKDKYLYLFLNNLLNNGFYRITKNKKTKKFVYYVESTKWINYKKIKIIKNFIEKKFKLTVKKYMIKEKKIGYLSKFFNRNEQKDFSNIYFFGRYAQNNPKIMLSDVIEKCYKLKKRF